MSARSLFVIGALTCGSVAIPGRGTLVTARGSALREQSVSAGWPENYVAEARSLTRSNDDRNCSTGAAKIDSEASRSSMRPAC